MRPVLINRAALGPSPWVPMNYLQNAFGVGLGAVISSGATLTYKVQHAFDDPWANRRQVSIARAGTVATVTDINHKLSVGDTIWVVGSGSSNLDGEYDVATVVDANSYTYTVVNTGATASEANHTWLSSVRAFDHATVVGETTDMDGNYAFPIRLIRLNVTAYTNGNVDLMILQGLGT